MTFLPAVGPILAGLALLGLSTATGAGAMRKLVRVYEAKHELKQGSAGFFRTLAGWSWIGIWAMATWFFATIIGDWAISGDLSAAVARSWLRLEILLHIASALSEADS
ncbi:hypothetical protein [Mameliella sediminis]|uniref:hypothetical protein n=1 Tax=Mameliella sediminis TaxID=2836866 RepID=UPI001C47F6E4|nr:hypothetical protein [Mameliella sediminis]MBY6115656.1 hypothetical protein [Antarctobacter heliothermus]MBY6145903.1 hypothetical protein [Mameliella alba]MBV7393376.1 hypothetical protein [Mameliella sediminis]MBY6161225.1 hypothetical protein [Mameliella alba]MBY6169695.1 hypothetical protein [Mameliella alba]